MMIDQREWENMREILRLFRDRKSLDALLEGHRSRESGIVPDSVSVEEAFHDLINQSSNIAKTPTRVETRACIPMP